MITIMPGLDVMKAMTDNNIGSRSSIMRRVAFRECSDLKTLADIEILLDGQLWGRIFPRLKDSHITFYESICRIDKSTVGVQAYSGIYNSMKWIASSESKARTVIIVTDSITSFVEIGESNVKIISPTDFLMGVQKSKILHNKKIFTSLEDALIAVFFPSL